MGFQAYCVHCEDFVEPKFLSRGPSGFILVLAGLAAFLGVSVLGDHSVRFLTLFSLLIGAVLTLYVLWRRPNRTRVCGLCGSPYIIMKDHLLLPPHGA